MDRFFWPGIIQLALPLALLVAIIGTDGTIKGYLIYLAVGLVVGRRLEAWNWNTRLRLGLDPPFLFPWQPWRRKREERP